MHSFALSRFIYMEEAHTLRSLLGLSKPQNYSTSTYLLNPMANNKKHYSPMFNKMVTDLQHLHLLEIQTSKPFSDDEIDACFGVTDPDFYSSL